MNTRSRRIISPVNIDVLFALITFVALCLQVVGSSNIVNTFSFFNVLINLLVAVSLVLPVLIPEMRAGKFFSSVSVQSAFTLYILTVGFGRFLYYEPFDCIFGAFKKEDSSANL